MQFRRIAVWHIPQESIWKNNSMHNINNILYSAGVLILLISALPPANADQNADGISALKEYNVGLSATKRHDYEVAIRSFTSAIRKNPRMAIAFCDRGAAYAQIGDFDKALSDFTTAIQIDPSHT